MTDCGFSWMPQKQSRTLKKTNLRDTKGWKPLKRDAAASLKPKTWRQKTFQLKLKPKSHFIPANFLPSDRTNAPTGLQPTVLGTGPQCNITGNTFLFLCCLFLQCMKKKFNTRSKKTELLCFLYYLQSE